MVYYFKLYKNQKTAAKVAKQIREEPWMFMIEPANHAYTFQTRSGKYGIKIEVGV